MTHHVSAAVITGGAGFIGSHLTDLLLSEGVDVTVLDNLSTGHMDNLIHVRDRIRFINGDIRNSSDLEDAFSGADTVFHQAAMVSVPLSIKDPAASADTNMTGTFRVLEAARRMGVRRVVLASSAAVYGDTEIIPTPETAPMAPMSPYALHKRFGEQHSDLYTRVFGLETVNLRYFNVYGPRQDPSSPYSGVISIFMDQAGAGTRPVIFGDGGHSRDFIFVRDVAAANLAAARHPDAAGGIYNVGTGTSIQILELWSLISRLAGRDTAPEFGPPRPGDIIHSRSIPDRIHAEIGFQASTSFADGLKEAFDWYQHRSSV